MTDIHTLEAYGARLRRFILATENDKADPTPSSATPDEPEFDEVALTLFRIQFRALPVYRRFCETRGATPESVQSWTEIPALPVAAFKETELTSLPPEERIATFHSSGTTGREVSRHFHGRESLPLYEASLLPPFRRHLFPDLDDLEDRPGLVILTPPPDAAPHSSLVHMFATARRVLGSRDSVFTGAVDNDGGWTLDLDRTLFALRKSMCANRPVTLLGTAFSFVHLLDHLEAGNIRYRLAAGTRLLETGGYKGRSRTMPKRELHAALTRRLGIPDSHIICEYGMSELSSQAYDRTVGEPATHPRLLRFPPWARVTIVNPETGRPAGDGEPGLIRILDLANAGSILAVQTEDLGVATGAGFTLLGRAEAAEPRGCSLMAV